MCSLFSIHKSSLQLPMQQLHATEHSMCSPRGGLIIWWHQQMR